MNITTATRIAQFVSGGSLTIVSYALATIETKKDLMQALIVPSIILLFVLGATTALLILRGRR